MDAGKSRVNVSSPSTETCGLRMPPVAALERKISAVGVKVRFGGGIAVFCAKIALSGCRLISQNFRGFSYEVSCMCCCFHMKLKLLNVF